MMKLIFLALCLVAGASAVVPWNSNPVLPGYPVIFVSWSSWSYFCDTVNKSEKQCFEDCMNAKGMGRYIDNANQAGPGCPPNNLFCTIPWRKTACQCASRCECRLAHCENSQCLFCRR